MLVGVISDTHGSINHYALAALQGVSLILHAGDIGKPAVIDALEEIAPVTAVYGNVDVGTPLARQFPSVQGILLEGVRVYMTHIGGRPDTLAHSLPEPRPDVYIFGHSHVALL